MRDNSEIDNLAKVNTQIRFQPIYTFIMRSGHVMIFGKLRGIFMDSAAIRTPGIAFDIDRSLKARFQEIGKISFDINREDVENYKLPIEDSEDLPRTKEVAIYLKKILNRLINHRIVTSPLTLDVYNSFIDAYETDPGFEPQGEILNMLALTYDCYIQAYLTDISSKPNFWTEASELSRKKHLEKFQSLLEWRLENSLKIGFKDRISLFINLTNLAYGINIEYLVNDYENNINLYIHNISSILIGNALPDLESEQSISHRLNEEKNTSSYDAKSLFWNPKAYDYLEKQEEIFNRYLPELLEKFAGKYIVFENGLVIDSDEDENSLLDRICDTEFYKQRPDAILLTFVPRSLLVNA
jgi:hypothetical protein